MDSTIERTRRAIEEEGLDRLVINDLVEDDLALIAWSGTPAHIKSVAGYLAKAAAGRAEYLVVRAVDGTPVAKCGLDYTEAPGLGTILQLATHEQLQGLGLATALIAAAEDRVRRRGLSTVRLGVGDDNPRARRLYERLGYAAVGRREVSWEAEAADGSPYIHRTVVTEMDKNL